MENLKFTTPNELFTNLYFNIINIEVLKTAVNMGFFDFLSQGLKTIEEIKIGLRLKIPSRNLFDLFDKLVTMGLFERNGFEENAAYQNSKSTNELFLKESPKNILSMFTLCLENQKSFQNLEKILREGHPENSEVFGKVYVNKDATKKFLYYMKAINEKNFEQTAASLSLLNEYRSMIDVGGALGVLALKIKNNYPEMHCITYDLPNVEEFVHEYLASEGSANKVEVVSGDFFRDDWPKTDVVFMGNILHDWDYSGKVFLLKKSYEKLNKGGILVCLEEFLDENREISCKAMNISVAMIVRTNGYNMTPKEFDSLAKEAGFQKTEYFKGDAEYCIAFK